MNPLESMNKMNKRSTIKVMFKLIVLVKPLIGFMFLAILLGLLGNLFATFITIFGGFAIGNILNESTMKLAFIFGGVILMALMRAFLRYGEQAMNHYIAFKLLARIRDQVFKALRKLSPAKLEGKDKGNLISIITSDIELLEVFYAHTISPIFIWLLYSIVMIVFLSSYHWLVGLMGAISYLVIGLILPIFINRIGKDDGINYRNEMGNLSSYVLDNLRGLFEIIQYDLGKLRKDKMKEFGDDLESIERKMKHKEGVAASITNGLILMLDILMLLVTTYYLKNDLKISEIIICNLAMMSSFGPSTALANLGTGLQNTIASGNRVLDIIEEEALVEDVKGKDEIEFDGVETKHLNFGYDDELILNDINLNINRNSIYGIVGKSGIGKSTLLKLLMRFWKVKDGKIEISSKSIDDINTSNLRKMESYLTQDTHLFHDSIKNNIKIGKLDASDKEIIEASKKASIHDFIQSLPKGYDSEVGELGDTLSSGEKQRIGLARAFLHDGDLMLLDEPSSSLDSLNEGIILKSLNDFKKDKTIVIVSHRDSVKKICDKEIVLDSKRVS